MYCNFYGKIPTFLNYCLQESLDLELIIIMVTLFCSRKIWRLCVELLYVELLYVELPQQFIL
jgi:hypothetical protein